MSGIALVAGIFQPKSVVGIYDVPDETVLRAEPYQLVENRVVDDAGNVGFDGLEVGGRYFVQGYVEGRPVSVRVTALDSEAPEAEPLGQPPISPTPQNVGTQEELQPGPDPHPAPEDLEVGVPEAVAAALDVPASDQTSAPAEAEQALPDAA